MSVSKHGHESDMSTKEIRDGNPDLILFYLRFSSRFSILCVLSMVYGATRKDKANEIERSATGVAFAWARKLFCLLVSDMGSGCAFQFLSFIL